MRARHVLDMAAEGPLCIHASQAARELVAALNLDQVADIVFSAATFHWIPDQDGLLRNIVRAL